MTDIAEQVFEVSLCVSLEQNGAERINFQRSAKTFSCNVVVQSAF